MSPIDDGGALQLLEQMVRIPSVSGDEGAIARFLVRRMEELGFDAWIDGAGNAVGEIGRGARTLALVGHMDTVPGFPAVRIEDGRLHGRGSVDAKGPLATFVAAAARVAASGLDLRLRVIGCVEEEVASSKGARFLMDQAAPEALVIGEPSGWEGITLGYKGYLRARLDFEGEAAHSAHDRPTVPAVAARAWGRIEGAAEAWGGGTERAFERLLPALLGLGSQADGCRSEAYLDLSLRLPLDLDPVGAGSWLAKLVPEARLQALGGIPAWSGPRTTTLHRALARSIRAQGVRPVWKQKTGTADLNLLAPAWGCPALAYGPGDAALDHTPQEHIVQEEYLRAIRVLEAALADWVALESARGSGVA